MNDQKELAGHGNTRRTDEARFGAGNWSDKRNEDRSEQDRLLQPGFPTQSSQAGAQTPARKGHGAAPAVFLSAGRSGTGSRPPRGYLRSKVQSGWKKADGGAQPAAALSLSCLLGAPEGCGGVAAPESSWPAAAEGPGLSPRPLLQMQARGAGGGAGRWSPPSVPGFRARSWSRHPPEEQGRTQ
ncbi:unnamed protein product [Rangifer tarandus platyrhynchus]|uniref:Uncharacterized protein n=2 Tax=Rangifer tarandus platyrhynchus TaxID=3082113 RepID=A0ACB0EQK6_RANTA|nr:unnamed protein product [Rangifer tarandus platyrhynchus]CAI9702346.1 unnamed protein product [Rangifer tarandus platyrhynchus]